MKFSVVNGERSEAEKGLVGTCIGCEQLTVPKCGPIKVKHWAHKSKRECDHWWENETEWHRRWKNCFPVEWQEQVHFASDGERHIADVKTNRDWVIEFQHSYLKPEERQSRNSFYKKIVWVVDGNRRLRHKAQFFKHLDEIPPISSMPIMRKVFLSFVVLLEEWAGSDSLVVFDFGIETPMWCLIPTKDDMWVHVAAISHEQFIELHGANTTSDFSEFILNLIGIVSHSELLHRQSMEREALRMSQSYLRRPLFPTRRRFRF